MWKKLIRSVFTVPIFYTVVAVAFLTVGVIYSLVARPPEKQIRLIGVPDAVCVRYETQFWADEIENYEAFQNFNWDLNYQGGAVAAYWKDPGVVIQLAEPMDDDAGGVQGNWCWGKQIYERVVNHPTFWGEVEIAPGWKVRQTGNSIAWSSLTLVEWNDEARTQRLERPYYNVVMSVVMKTDARWRKDVEALCRNHTGTTGVCDLDQHIIHTWDDEKWLCWDYLLGEAAKTDPNMAELRDFLAGVLDYSEHILKLEDPLWCTKHPQDCRYTPDYWCKQHQERVQAERYLREHPEEGR